MVFITISATLYVSVWWSDIRFLSLLSNKHVYTQHIALAAIPLASKFCSSERVNNDKRDCYCLRHQFIATRRHLVAYWFAFAVAATTVPFYADHYHTALLCRSVSTNEYHTCTVWVKKKVASLKLFAIFSLRLSIFPWNFASMLPVYIYTYLPILVDLS